MTLSTYSTYNCVGEGGGYCAGKSVCECEHALFSAWLNMSWRTGVCVYVCVLNSVNFYISVFTQQQLNYHTFLCLPSSNWTIIHFSVYPAATELSYISVFTQQQLNYHTFLCLPSSNWTIIHFCVYPATELSWHKDTNAYLLSYKECASQSWQLSHPIQKEDITWSSSHINLNISSIIYCHTMPHSGWIWVQYRC